MRHAWLRLWLAEDMFRMNHLSLLYRVVLAGVLAGAALSVTQAGELPVAPFVARYEVYASGFALGEAVMRLDATGAQGYTMRSDVRPSGLATLVAGQIQEQVSGEIRDHQVRPLHYQRQTETGKRAGTLQLDFDWSAGRIQARDHETQVELPLTPGVLDPLSLNLAVMIDLQRGQLPEQYTLIDATRIKTYQIRTLGEEWLDTPLGRLRTVRINQYTPGKSRNTTFWFAPDQHYLPVRVAQHKNDKEELRMEIRAVERSSR